MAKKVRCLIFEPIDLSTNRYDINTNRFADEAI